MFQLCHDLKTKLSLFFRHNVLKSNFRHRQANSNLFYIINKKKVNDNISTNMRSK